MVGRSHRRQDRRLPPWRSHVRTTTRTRRHTDQSGGSGQYRGLHAVHSAGRERRARNRRLFPARRRRPLFEVRPISAGHGGGKRGDSRRRADRRHHSAGPRTSRAATRGHRCGRRGLRQRTRRQPARPALSRQPVRRLRLFRGGCFGRPHGGSGHGAHQREFRGSRRHKSSRLQQIRPDHRVRHDP